MVTHDLSLPEAAGGSILSPLVATALFAPSPEPLTPLEDGKPVTKPLRAAVNFAAPEARHSSHLSQLRTGSVSLASRVASVSSAHSITFKNKARVNMAAHSLKNFGRKKGSFSMETGAVRAEGLHGLVSKSQSKDLDQPAVMLKGDSSNRVHPAPVLAKGPADADVGCDNEDDVYSAEEQPPVQLQGRSLFIFSGSNRFRILMHEVCRQGTGGVCDVFFQLASRLLSPLVSFHYFSLHSNRSLQIFTLNMSC